MIPGVGRPRKLQEGAWFAVPLDTGYLLGLLARVDDPGGFAYFFAPPLSEIPEPGYVPERSLAEAVYACRFTVGALRTGEWQTIGQHRNWDRDEWPIPPFCYYDEA